MNRLPLIAVAATYRLTMGLVFATPVAAVAAGVVGEHPRGDAILWEAGGYWLVEAGRLVRGHLAAPLLGGGFAVFAMTFGWLVFVAALIHRVQQPELGAKDLVRGSLDLFAPLAVLFGVTLFSQAVAIGGLMWFGARFAEPTRTGDLFRMAMAGTGVFVAAVMAIGHDAARVTCVVDRLPFWEFVNRTFERLRAKPAALLVAAAWRGAVVWLALMVALTSTRWLLPGGTVAVLGALLVQWAMLLLFVFLRTSWFTWLVAALPPRPPEELSSAQQNRAQPNLAQPNRAQPAPEARIPEEPVPEDPLSAT